MMHEAAGSGNLDITQLLLSRGADVNTLDHQENSPLHEAVRIVRSQNQDVAELLLKRGSDVDVQNIDDSTPLHEAAGSGNERSIRYRHCDYQHRASHSILSGGTNGHSVPNTRDYALR
jgi:ankyrin repeat protein